LLKNDSPICDKNEESNLFAMVARDTPGVTSFVDYLVATSEIESNMECCYCLNVMEENIRIGNVKLINHQ